MKKIILINLSIFLISIFLIESIFGYWFDDNNFGYHMRKHRNRSDFHQIKINNIEYKYYYKRNFYGFRGPEINKLEKVKYVFLGGSTGNEKFLPEELTIVGQLNYIFSKNNKNIKITNASVDGKTIRGHINDFQIWFPKLENFKPKYFIIYAGINDSVIDQPKKYDLTYDDNILKKIRDYIANNSLIIELIKKIKWKYFKKTKLKYDVKNNSNLYDNFYYFNYKKAKEIYNFDLLKIKHNNLFKRYVLRLNKLYDEIIKSSSDIIFITQIKHDGLKDEKLFLLNETLKNFSTNNKISIIKLDELFDGTINDFYDTVHTTPQGSKKIANIIFKELNELIIN